MTTTPSLYLTMVIWNNKDYLSGAMASIEKQTDRDFGMIVVDNGSLDGGGEYLREKFPGVMVIRNTNNLGFARAHNQAIAMARTLWQHGQLRATSHEPRAERLILVTNPDIILEPNCIIRLRRAILQDNAIGSAGAKLYKISRASFEEDGSIHTNVVDSTGLKIFSNRRMVDRGAGEIDRGQYHTPGEVFGITGALALYRLDALEDTSYQLPVTSYPQYFDEAQYLYKEDIDLAWRLRLRGWKAWYEPTAIAYHYRGAYGSEKRGLWTTIRERWQKPSRINFYSYRNHFLVLAKNEQWQNKLRHYPWIMAYELGKLLYIICLEPKTLRAIPSFLHLLPDALRKRRWIQSRRKVSAESIRHWFT